MTKIGKPKIVFHGTDASFSTFEIGDLGFHVGSNAQAKSIIQYTNKTNKILPLYASIQHPLRTNDPEEWFYPRRAIEVLSQTGTHTVLNFDKLAKMIANAERKIPRSELYSKWSQIGSKQYKVFKPILSEIRKEMETGGFDGIVYKNKYEGNGDSWIAFHSSQLKSIYASHFNPNDGNIFD